MTSIDSLFQGLSLAAAFALVAMLSACTGKAVRTTETPAEAGLDEALGAFLEDPFGPEQPRHWRADFDGDGKDELVVQVRDGTFFAFHDTSTLRPETWEVLSLEEAADVAVSVEAADLAKRRTEGRAAGAQLVIGGRAPMAVYFHAEHGEYAWEQVYPRSLEDLLNRARADSPEAHARTSSKRTLHPIAPRLRRPC